jgi:hypothetical protein
LIILNHKCIQAYRHKRKPADMRKKAKSCSCSIFRQSAADVNLTNGADIPCPYIDSHHAWRIRSERKELLFSKNFIF